MYAQDISIAGFSDVAFGEGDIPLYSAGLEIRMESSLGFNNLAFIPSAGIAFNKDGISSIYINLMLFSFGGQGLNEKMFDFNISGIMR